MRTFTVEALQVSIYEEAGVMGKAAANFVGNKLLEAITDRGAANLILATGASQFSFLDALKERDIDWKKITVFHLDEYKGISAAHPASFRRYLRERILDEVGPKKIYFLNGDEDNLETEMFRYAEELKKHAVDIACIGIGENGHIAFNDPGDADFNDPKLVKLVKLDEACRNQQLGEGWFPTLGDVPGHALTLTIPAIMNCKTISCAVSDERKAKAVFAALYRNISTECPASILRTHPDAQLFLDTASASKI